MTCSTVVLALSVRDLELSSRPRLYPRDLITWAKALVTQTAPPEVACLVGLKNLHSSPL